MSRYFLEIITSSGLIVGQKLIHLIRTRATFDYKELEVGTYYIRMFNGEHFYGGKLFIVG